MDARAFFKDIINEPNIKKYLEFIQNHHQETYEHSLRVGLYSTIISFNKLFDIGQVRLAAISGLLHDIGKLGIEKEILSKQGPLDNNERKEINEHPRLGFDFLLSFPIDIRKIIIAHHEYDELTSYPRKQNVETNILKSRQDDLIVDTIAQIVAISDVYDALTHQRSYKEAYSKQMAIEMLKNPQYMWDSKIISILEEKL